MSERIICFMRNEKTNFEGAYFMHFHLPSSLRLRLSSAPYVRDCYSIGGHRGAKTYALAEVSLTSRARKSVWANWKPR
jgi:hypothetical protein